MSARPAAARRWALLLALALALAVDAYVYWSFPQLRSLAGRQHWIFYAYLSAIVALAAAGVALGAAWLAARLSWPTRS